MFVDRIKIFAKAGDGGRGCVSFRREKFVPRGGPDGGDGGRGGDVVLRADEHTDNLVNLFYEPIVKAKNGVHGQGKKMHGRAAAPKVVKVPVGTIVWKDEGGGIKDEVKTENKRSSFISSFPLLVDLNRDRQEFVLCRGGAGGKGNVHFKSSRNRAPRQYTEGGKGEEEEGIPPTKIDGIGEAAYWMGSRVGGALYVLKKDAFIRISVGGADTQEAKIDKSKALAQKALDRL